MIQKDNSDFNVEVNAYIISYPIEMDKEQTNYYNGELGLLAVICAVQFYKI